MRFPGTQYLITFLVCTPSAVAQNIKHQSSAVLVPPRPSEVASSSVFEVKVRPAAHHSSKWQDVPLYKPQVHEINATTGSARRIDTSLAYFDYDGAVVVSVTPNEEEYPSIDNVRVRPLSYNIESTIHNREITFHLQEPHHNVVVEINGDVFNVLHIWSNTVDKDPLTKGQADDNEDIIYFGPGYHDLEESHDGTLNLTSGQTVYLAAGAAVHGALSIINETNVTVRGRGMLFHAKDHGVLVEYSKNVLIEGISVVNPGHYSLTAASSKGLTVRNFRGMSAVQWGDGIDLFCMQDALLEGIFMRTSDDCVAIYQHRWNYYGDSKNITIRDSSLWADVAHPIHMGLHGNTVDPETMSDVKFENVDIMDHREPQVDYQGCIAINSGDENLIENITFSDIRVEDFRHGMLLQMRVTYNPKYNKAPGRGIRNIKIKDLSYGGDGGVTPVLVGYSPERAVELVEFENLTINGQKVYDEMQKPAWYLTSDFIPMIVGPNAINVTFAY